MNNKEQLQELLNKQIDNRKVFGTSFSIKYKGEKWTGSAGNLTSESSYFIASTTKLFTTAVILNLETKGFLKLDDLILKYLNEQLVTGLNRYKNTDYSNNITIRRLLAHTSGIPDYFQGKDNKGNSLEKQLINGNDEFWSFENVIERSKTLISPFPVGQKGKALYSDTNFQLLGKIVENISRKSIEQNFQELIIEPLGLSKTYLYKNPTDTTPNQLYYKNNELHIPQAMSSFGPDGGIVSTSTEMLQFVEAFFKGQFFPKEKIEELKEWNRIFYPMKSGTGIHQFKLPWLFNPLGTIPELIGHSGLSGAMAYCNPEKDLYIAGTVNQIAYPSTSFKLAIKLIQKVMKK